jgi:hypothetical protein
MSALFVLSLSYGKYKLLKEERKYIKDELKENNNLVNFVKKSYELIDKNYFNTFFPEETKQLIAETDFYALSDVTMSSDMTTYRQALRDITSHSNWPNLESDDWPTKP